MSEPRQIYASTMHRRGRRWSRRRTLLPGAALACAGLVVLALLAVVLLAWA